MPACLRAPAGVRHIPTLVWRVPQAGCAALLMWLVCAAQGLVCLWVCARSVACHGSNMCMKETVASCHHPKRQAGPHITHTRRVVPTLISNPPTRADHTLPRHPPCRQGRRLRQEEFQAGCPTASPLLNTHRELKVVPAGWYYSPHSSTASPPHCKQRTKATRRQLELLAMCLERIAPTPDTNVSHCLSRRQPVTCPVGLTLHVCDRFRLRTADATCSPAERSGQGAPLPHTWDILTHRSGEHQGPRSGQPSPQGPVA
jgi:hypothetical protein